MTDAAASVPTFCHYCRRKCADQATGDRGMGRVDVLRNKAEEYLEKARAISDRQTCSASSLAGAQLSQVR
jgi:hypothetical protein